MRNKKSKNNNITYKGFFHLHNSLLACDDFISLKGNSIKLLIDLGRQYNGHNNGDLCASMSLMRKYGWNSNQQLTKALKELISKNLIIQTRQGGLNMGPNLYALTWQRIHNCNGKLDIAETISAPRKFPR